MEETRAFPKISRIAPVKVVSPEPLSPATPMAKTRGDRAMTSLKFPRFMDIRVIGGGDDEDAFRGFRSPGASRRSGPRGRRGPGNHPGRGVPLRGPAREPRPGTPGGCP